MKTYKAIITFFFLYIFYTISNSYGQNTSDWYAGLWDSKVYMPAYHPSTIAFRIEVEGEDSRAPLSGAEVRVEGKWEEPAHINQYDRRTITRDFRLISHTDSRGITVFGLRWKMGMYDVFNVEDIEKVQVISVRCEGYKYQEIPINFLEIAKYRNDDAWKELIIATPGAKYFVLQLGKDYDGFGIESSTDQIFFEKIRNEDYGILFRAKEKTGDDFPFYFFESNPPQEAGPFMMLPFHFKMERLPSEHEIKIKQ